MNQLGEVEEARKRQDASCPLQCKQLEIKA